MPPEYTHSLAHMCSLPDQQGIWQLIRVQYSYLILWISLLNFWYNLLTCLVPAFASICQLAFQVFATEIATILTLPKDMWFFTFYSTKPAVELWFSWRALPWLNYCASQVWGGVRSGAETPDPTYTSCITIIFTVAPFALKNIQFR